MSQSASSDGDGGLGGSAAPSPPPAESPSGQEPPAGAAARGRDVWTHLPRRLIWRWLMRVMVALVLSSAALVGTLRWADPPASAFMLRHALNVWRLDQTPPYYQHQWLPWERMPATIRLAAIAGEDQRFPDHLGLDLIEIRHALSDYLEGRRLRGASTISQQTAKNLFLWPGSGWWRKLAEGWLALLMEVLWPKARILEVYLNIAQFSPSTYGIEATSQRFFGHPASDLTLDEAALMIGVLPAPGNHSLQRPDEGLQRRAAWIREQARTLGRMRYLERL